MPPPRTRGHTGRRTRVPPPLCRMSAMRPVRFRGATPRRMARTLCFDVDEEYMHFTRESRRVDGSWRATHCFLGRHEVRELDDEALAMALLGPP